jgi:hypothetical protein
MNSRLIRWLGLLIALLAAISPANADTIFDQTNTGTLVGGGNILNFGPVGQSFTPTLTSLNFVNLMTGGAHCCQGGSFFPYTLEVDIHSQSIFGTILGTSEPVTVHPPGPHWEQTPNPDSDAVPVFHARSARSRRAVRDPGSRSFRGGSGELDR